MLSPSVATIKTPSHDIAHIVLSSIYIDMLLSLARSPANPLIWNMACHLCAIVSHGSLTTWSLGPSHINTVKSAEPVAGL